MLNAAMAWHPALASLKSKSSGSSSTSVVWPTCSQVLAVAILAPGSRLIPSHQNRQICQICLIQWTHRELACSFGVCFQ